ncbi:MAG: hypothetical protein KA233_05245 [Novosphingobium sp.]|jgi:hypothetical protein|nr:hypothetical protein [Novosphingobium sp.]MBP6555068.1 hypothetical protein [Novosphingobium sp.]
MKGAQFGLIALIPAMFNLTVASSGGSITMQICTGDGVVHTVQMPLGGSGEGDGNAPGLCCAKGCHNGNSRKRAPAKFEPAQ